MDIHCALFCYAATLSSHKNSVYKPSKIKSCMFDDECKAYSDGVRTGIPKSAHQSICWALFLPI